MHIPDGFLTNRIAFSLDALSGVTLLAASRRLQSVLSGRMIPVMGVLSAFVFAAQMLNFPVLGGTSGHLVGGAMLGILLGPVAALLAMATVVLAQALFLQDGGLVALGANIFNIGALTVFSGYAVYRLFGSPELPGTRLTAAAFAAGWISMVISASACAFQLALSGAIPLRIGLPAMAGYHMLIGIGEGALTAGVISFLARVRPDLLRRDFRSGFGWADWAGGLVLVGIPAAILVLAGSSSLPDPLQALLEPPAAAATAPYQALSAGHFPAPAWLLICIALLALAVLSWFAARMIRRRPS